MPRNNVIVLNKAFDPQRERPKDGGAIYVLGVQPGGKWLFVWTDRIDDLRIENTFITGTNLQNKATHNCTPLKTGAWLNHWPKTRAKSFRWQGCRNKLEHLIGLNRAGARLFPQGLAAARKCSGGVRLATMRRLVCDTSALNCDATGRVVLDMKKLILHDDALAALRELDDASAQLVIADSPYFRVLGSRWDRQWPDAAAYLDWSLAWLTETMRVLRDDGLLYCFGQLGKREHTFLHLMSEATRRWQFHDLITWDRAVGYNERRDSFTPATEMILVLRKSAKPKFNKSAVRELYDAATVKEYLRDKRYKNLAARRQHLAAGKYATNLWRIPSLKGNSSEKCGHPAQKPEQLIERIILSSSEPGDLVLDPFLGSGTTAVVAERHGRRWLGIEMSATYVKLARKRIAAERRRKK